MGQTYNGWSNWETWHTSLLAENEEPSYRQGVAMAQCVLKHKAKGQYDPARAAKGFQRIFAPQWRTTREFLKTNAEDIGQGWTEDYRNMEQPNWLEIAENWVERVEA